MRRLVESLVRLLPFDARGRRALEETFADWKNEEAHARTPMRRLAHDLRAVASVLRALLYLTARETVHLPVGRLGGRLAILAVLPATVLVLVQAGPAFLRRFPDDWPQVVSLLLPSMLLTLLPLASFFAAAWPLPKRRFPALGFAVSALVLTLALAGWIVPLANRQFRRVTYASLSTEPVLKTGPSEMTLPQLVAGALGRGARPASQTPLPGPQLDQVFLLTGFAVVCPGLVLLATTVQHVPRWHRRAWLVGVPLAYGATRATRLLPSHHPGPWLGFWALAALSITSFFVMRRVFGDVEMT